MVPDGWSSIRLSEMTETITSGSRDWAQYYSEEGSKFIRMTNLPRHGIDLKLHDLKFVDVKSNSSDGKRTSLHPGDILISITAELGKIGLVPKDLGEAYINQHTALVRLKKDSYFPRYVAYYLSSQPMNHRINRLNDSGAKSGLNLSTIRSFALTTPPLPEQRKIAKILQTWDRAIATTEKLIDASKQQKKALMQQLLTGKKRFPGFEGEFNSDNQFPSGWAVRQLDDIALKVMVGIASAATHAYREDGVRMLRNLNIKEGWIDDSDILHIDVEYEKQHKNKRLKAGDILTVRTGYPGLSAVVNLQYQDAQCFTSLITRIDANLAIPEYVCRYINSEYGKKFITSGEAGGAQKNVNASMLKKMRIPLPSIPEQREIVSILSSLDRELDHQKTKLIHLKQEKKALMQQLLTGKRRVKIDG